MEKKWAFIAQFFQNRTDVSLKNHWINIERRDRRTERQIFNARPIQPFHGTSFTHVEIATQTDPISLSTFMNFHTPTFNPIQNSDMIPIPSYSNINPNINPKTRNLLEQLQELIAKLREIHNSFFLNITESDIDNNNSVKTMDIRYVAHENFWTGFNLEDDILPSVLRITENKTNFNQCQTMINALYNLYKDLENVYNDDKNQFYYLQDNETKDNEERDNGLNKTFCGIPISIDPSPKINWMKSIKKETLTGNNQDIPTFYYILIHLNQLKGSKISEVFDLTKHEYNKIAYSEQAKEILKEYLHIEF